MKLNPFAMLSVITLHYFIGNVLATVIYRVRYGKNPNIPNKKLNQKSRHMVLTKAGALLFLLWLVSFCLGVFGPENLLFRPLFEADHLLGLSICLFCLIGMTLAQYLMGESFRIGQDDDEKKSQMSQGPLLKYSRNPIYVFSYAFFIGATLWVPSIATLGLFIALGVSIHLLVLEEEKFLQARLGNDYMEYKQKVPRYFIF